MIKLIFLVLSIYRINKYNSLGLFSRKVVKWTNTFCIKMLVNIFISINYSCFAILFKDQFGDYSFMYFANSFIWIISTSLLYFEYRRKLTQSWTGLRLFWLFNGIAYIVKLFYYFNFCDHYVNQC